MEPPGFEEARAITEGFQALGTLLVVLSGLLIIVGATRIGKRFLFLGIFAAVFAGFHPLLLEDIPLPLLLVAGVLITLALFGLFLSVFIGKRASDVAIGNIVSNLVSLIVVLLFLPVRKIWKHFEGTGAP